MPTSYNGWPASKDPNAIGVDQAWEPISGHDFPGGVKAGDVEVVMTYLVVQLDARVEPIELYPPGDEWGYNYKQSANSPNLLSCHSSATAVDWNAVKHPNRRRGTFTDAQIVTIRQILAECSGVIRWGGDFTRTPDEMHFEIKGSPAQVKAAADKIKAGTPPQHGTEDPEMDHHGHARIGMRVYLGRNPNDQTELDTHAWYVAVHGLDAHRNMLQESAEGKTYEAKLAAELKTKDQ